VNPLAPDSGENCDDSLDPFGHKSATMPQREVDVLIAGAGIAGLLLARELQKRGQRVLIVHDPDRPGAGEAAVGLLNPVRGRRYTLAWRAAEVFAEAAATYRAIGASDGRDVFSELPVLRVFSSSEERARWTKRVSLVEAAGFLHCELSRLPAGFRPRLDEGAIEITGGGVVDPRVVLEVLRAEQRACGALFEGVCAIDDCEPSAHGLLWRPGHVFTTKLVLAGGAADIATLRARGLTLRPVKGESLLLDAPGLDATAAYVCGHHLVPLGDGTWICGGTKVPGDDTDGPTEAGRAELTAFLDDHLSTDWTMLAHWSGVRAVTLDTRPIAGPLNLDGRVIVLNGLGSQGFAVGPWVARVLADHLSGGAPLPADLLPERFAPQRAE
jgi:glycine oxidase